MLVATLAQRLIRDAERRADFGNAGKGLGLEQILEPGENTATPAGALHFRVDRARRQALDEAWITCCSKPCAVSLSAITSDRASTRRTAAWWRWRNSRSGARRGAPPRGRRDNEFGSRQGATVLGQFPLRQSNGAPAAGPVCPRMHPLAGSEGNQLARPQLHAAPDRSGSIADGQRNHERVRGHRDKGDPREALVARRQAQIVHCDLRQPCPEFAMAGDQKVEDRFLAPRRLKILRFAKKPT
jgi:hypothetical protein